MKILTCNVRLTQIISQMMCGFRIRLLRILPRVFVLICDSITPSEVDVGNNIFIFINRCVEPAWSTLSNSLLWPKIPIGTKRP